jgi:hypothetical protein
MPVPSAAFLWTGTDSDVASLVFERKPTSLRMLVHNFKPTAVQAGLRALQLPEGRYRLATALDLNSDRKPDAEPQSQEVELRRFTPLLVTLPSAQTLWVELSLLAARPKALRPDLAVTLAKPVSSDGRLVAHVHNLGGAAATNVVVRLVAGDGRKLAESTLAELPGITGFEPQVKEVEFSLPTGVKAEGCALLVDPDDKLDEINESNNRYELARGVPPPVETPPKK